MCGNTRNVEPRVLRGRNSRLNYFWRPQRAPWSQSGGLCKLAYFVYSIPSLLLNIPRIANIKRIGKPGSTGPLPSLNEQPPPPPEPLLFGSCASTVIVELPDDILPARSVAVNVMVVEPIGKVEGASFSIFGFSSTASLAEAPLKKEDKDESELDMPLPEVAVTVTLAGIDIVGAVVSDTVRTTEAVTKSPDESATEKVTMFSPSTANSPRSFEIFAVRSPSSGSDAAASDKKLATDSSVMAIPFGPAASTVAADGTTRTGDAFSSA